MTWIWIISGFVSFIYNKKQEDKDRLLFCFYLEILFLDCSYSIIRYHFDLHKCEKLPERGMSCIIE